MTFTGYGVDRNHVRGFVSACIIEFSGYSDEEEGSFADPDRDVRDG